MIPVWDVRKRLRYAPTLSLKIPSRYSFTRLGIIHTTDRVTKDLSNGFDLASPVSTDVLDIGRGQFALLYLYKKHIRSYAMILRVGLLFVGGSLPLRKAEVSNGLSGLRQQPARAAI